MLPCEPGPAPGRQRLNAADRFLLAVDRTLRQLGGPGFETQTFVVLAGRLERDRLQAALAGLSRRHSVLTSRLVEDGEQGGPFWQFRPGETCPLAEVDLEGPAAPAAVEHAGLLFAAPSDPASVPPVRFHLLHGGDGRDVLVAQYNHALLDHGNAVRLLGQLGRPGEEPEAPPSPWRDPIWGYLQRFPRRRRHDAAGAAQRWRQELRGGAIHLGRPTQAGGPVRLRVQTRRLEAPQAQAVQAQVLATCGTPSLSMALLGSAFRAIARLADQPFRGRYFNAGIGIDLGLGEARRERIQNLATLVPIQALPDEVADRDALQRLLARQLRERLASGMDLGVLTLTATLGRQQRQARWACELLLRYCLSLWYGYFGPLDSLGPTLCGVDVEEVFSAGPAWPPVGLTLLANQWRGRLYLQATYVPACLPDAVAERFLDEVVADLLAGGPGG